MRFVRTAESLFGLPGGFTRVEYLQSSGTQYIDTGYKLNSNSVLEVSACSTDATQSNNTLLGVGTSAGSADRVQVHFGSAAGTLSARLDGTLSSNQSIGINKFISKIDISNKKAYLNNIEIVSNYTGSIDTTDNVALFNRMISGNVIESEYAAKAKVYYLRISENNTLVRDFIPCIDPLGRACLYDLVGKKPYYNQGTGEFTVGRQIIPVEYLESTGTQYIDTMIKSGVNMSVKAKFNLSDVSAKAVFGSYSGSASNGVGVFFGTAGGNLSGKVYCNNTNVAVSPDLTLSANTDYEIEMSGTTLIVNGSAYTSATTADNNYNMALFARSNNGTIERQISGKVYYFTIKDNNTLVCNLIPCKDENNVGFMFDTLSGTVYLNAGTGAFSVGENKYTSKLRLIKEAKELPDGYKRVEYLESDSTAYIDTGVSGANNNLKIEMGFSYSKFYAYGYFFSNYESEQHNTTRFLLDASNNSRGLAYINTKSQDGAIYISNITKDSFHTFVLTKTSLTVDGITTTNNNPPVGTANTKNIILFNRGAGSYADKRDVGMRCYYFRIYDNDVLVRDLIPVLDNSGIPAMYDKVNGGTYYNQGTGSFTYGHTITPVEYIESTGTQYIDTGYIPQSNVKIETDFQLTEIPSDTFATLCGSLPATQNYSGIFVALNYTVPIQARTGLNTNPNVISTYNVNTDRYKLSLEFNKLTINGNVFTPTTLNTWYNTNNPLYFFSCSGYDQARRRIKAKMWYFKVYAEETLVRSFIPVRDENNVGYMFDEVTGQLFGNAGSGSFGIGNDLRKPKVRFVQDVLPREYRPLKYLESTGTQYINTGYKPNTNTRTVGRVRFNSFVGSNADYIFGVFSSPNNYGLNVGSARQYFNVPWGSSAGIQLNGLIPQRNKDYEFDISKTGYLIDSQSYGEISTASVNSTRNMYLFWSNGTSASGMNGRIYNFKIYDNNTLIRNFIPVIRLLDNKAGMWDTVTKQFYGNAGTGEFNYE